MKLTPQSIVRTIDFELLVEQKETLLMLIMKHEGQRYSRIPDPLVVEHLGGILNLLDDIHDTADPTRADRPKIRAVGKANHPES
jgi:hypothetical protein